MIGSWDKLDYIAFKMAATKSSKDARQVGLSWHEKRGEVREKSTKGKQFRSSLQCLDNNEILLLLESILARLFGLVMNPPPLPHWGVISDRSFKRSKSIWDMYSRED